MKRLLEIVAVLAFVVVTAPLEGAAPDCVPQEKCPENMGPPGCCQPPPCQIYEYLKQMRAMQRVTSDERAKKALRESKGDHLRAIASLKKAFEDESGTLKKVSNKKCPLTPEYSAPTFRVKECVLEVQKPSGWAKVGGALSLLNDFEKCNELIEGEFARMNHMQESCAPAMPPNVRTYAARTRNSAQDSIDSTVAHLQRYYQACSSKLPEDEDALKQLEEVEEVEMDTPLQVKIKDLQQKSAPKPKPSVSRRSQRGGR